MKKAMIISVGGSLSPLIYTLNEIKPSYIIFFTSLETKNMVPKIMEKLTFTPESIDQITTSSAEVLDECYKCLIDELPKKIKMLNITPEDLIVDYTGGTKTMSSALVLATIDLSCEFSYVGGEERDKNGVGVVMNGKEKRWYLKNPWDELAVKERERINLYFNKARYTAAREVLENLVQKVSEDSKPYYEMLLDLIEGYELWDRFKHKDANEKIQKALKKLQLYTSQRKDDNLTNLTKEVENNVQFIECIIKDNKIFIVYDLIANAIRRANIENKYDDAAARLYRALEKMAQVRLEEKYNINTSDVKLDQLPNSLKEKYKNKYYDDRKNKIRIPLFASYELLNELNDELGKIFFDNYKEINKILEQRNSSILAHGEKPIKKETFEKLLQILFDLFQIKKGDIPQFPILNI